MEGHIFAGQGAQHPGMAVALLEKSTLAKALFDQANKILGWDVTTLCLSGSMEELTACATCQPAIFAVSVISYMIRRQEGTLAGGGIFGGLSLGEWSALCCAGAISFEDALKVVARRGELMDECCHRHPGSMCAVLGAEVDAVEKACLENQVEIANFNCPGQLIISGESSAVDKAAAALRPSAVKVVPLAVAGAYHSKLMRDAGKAFADYLTSVAMQLPTVPLVHNLTGQYSGNSIDELKDVMARQIYSSVKWEQCVRTMLPDCQSFHEYGPGKTLSGLVHRIERKIPVESDNL